LLIDLGLRVRSLIQSLEWCGGGASDIAVDDYEQMLVPDLSNLKIDFDFSLILFSSELIRYETR